MIRKETSEKREFYKPFRCTAGYILALQVIVSLLQISSTGLMSIAMMIFTNPDVAEFFSNLILYGTMVLGYYLGYRIFFKKFVHQVYSKESFDSKQLPKLLLTMAGTGFVVLASWQLWAMLLGAFGYTLPQSDSAIGLADILYICIGAPVIEELVFRYWFRKVLQPYGCWSYVLISALSFGLFHGTVSQSVPATAIGIAFGLIAWHYQATWPTVILHIANNTLSTLETFYEISISENVILIGAGIFVLIMLVLSIRKINWRELPKPLRLIPHSYSYLIFMIMYIVTILIEALA